MLDLTRRAQRVRDAKTGDIYHSLQHAHRVTGVCYAIIQRATSRGDRRRWQLTTAAATVATDVSPLWVDAGDRRRPRPKSTAPARPARRVRDLRTLEVYPSIGCAARTFKTRNWNISRSIARGQRCRGRRWEWTTAAATVEDNRRPMHRPKVPVLVGKRPFPSMLSAANHLGVRHTEILCALQRRHRCRGHKILRADSLEAMRILGKAAGRERRRPRLENRLPVLMWEALRVGA